MGARSIGNGWTYAEFARIPSEGGARHEVIAGELVMTPAPGVPHQAAVTDLTVSLSLFIRSNEIGQVLVGPVDILFAEGDYLEPDVVVVLDWNEHLLSDRGIEGPPDLVVEVVSPSTASRDRGSKLERYRHYGVPEYWVVDPVARVVEVWGFSSGATEAAVYRHGDVIEWDPGTGPAILSLPVDHVLS